MSDAPARAMKRAADVRQFALAGNAVLTLRSTHTDTRYTLQIMAPDEKADADQNKRFVRLLTGPNNTEDYTYLGMITDLDVAPIFRLTKKSRMGRDAAPVRATTFLCSRVLAQPDAPLPTGLEIWHEGRCGRCRRTLTVPESIERGIGPECAEKMGIRQMARDFGREAA